ncbi:MAG: hypothetical protein EU530_04295 [Promethearchaeota archaeon]|nr:MAG: hypothetical protein EU530_04295 [Candidatus Lokiarchaeota archaeon]
MPKYKKGKKQVQEEQDTRQRMSDQKTEMYNSSIRSLIVGGICFVLSLLFNGSLINITPESGTAADVLLILMKSLFIVVFYTFTLIGLANAMELRGKPSALREVFIIGAMAIIQGILSLPVFFVSLIGVILATLYLWGVQVRVERY